MAYSIIHGDHARADDHLHGPPRPREGRRATSIDDVLAHSGAPRGSVYHHFPGGRRQLLRRRRSSPASTSPARIERAPTALDILDCAARRYREQLIRSDFRAGCPVVAVAVEAGDPESRPARARRRRLRALDRPARDRARGRRRERRERAGELATLVDRRDRGRARHRPSPPRPGAARQRLQAAAHAAAGGARDRSPA